MRERKFVQARTLACARTHALLVFIRVYLAERNKERKRKREIETERQKRERQRERERERERRMEREGRRGSRCAVDLVGSGVKTKIEAEPADTRFLRNYGSRLVPSRVPVNQSPLRRSYIFSVNYFYSRLRA